MADEKENCGLHRCIDWKQGFLIAIGIPLAIIPSIGLTTGLLWGFSIVLWGMCVLQGFLQNMAFGELATTFPKLGQGMPPEALRRLTRAEPLARQTGQRTARRTSRPCRRMPSVWRCAGATRN